MRCLLFVSLSLISLCSFSKEKMELDSTIMGFTLRSNQPDSSVSKNMVQYEFNFIFQKKFNGKNTLDYAINELSFTQMIDTNSNLTLSLLTDKNTFQFFLPGYYEISIPLIPTKFGNKVLIDLYFNSQDYPKVICDKPVIYLYPKETMNCKVEVLPKGEFTFTYPEYKNGWDLLAEPNGDLHVNGQDLNYLFWESSQKWIPSSTFFIEGSIIDKADLISFLENKLNEFGLNSEEKADFITYWAPQLLRNNANFIRFLINDEANQFAELKVSPTPDHIYRIYMISYPIERYDVSLCRPQKLGKIDRSGYTVIEWGGSIIDKEMSIYNSEL